MVLAHFRMINNELLKKDLDVVSEISPLVMVNKNQLYAWLTMVRTPNTSYTLLE